MMCEGIEQGSQSTIVNTKINILLFHGIYRISVSFSCHCVDNSFPYLHGLHGFLSGKKASGMIT